MEYIHSNLLNKSDEPSTATATPTLKSTCEFHPRPRQDPRIPCLHEIIHAEAPHAT